MFVAPRALLQPPPPGARCSWRCARRQPRAHWVRARRRACGACAASGPATPWRVPHAPLLLCPRANAECPACGRASPRLLLPQPVADWLLEAAGPASLVSRADFAPYDGAGGGAEAGPSGKVWASHALSDTLQSGTGVAHVLQAVLARRGEALPFPTDVLRAGSAPPLRLQNWTLLAPLLAAFDITLSDDNKTLIVAGGAWISPGAARASWLLTQPRTLDAAPPLRQSGSRWRRCSRR